MPAYLTINISTTTLLLSPLAMTVARYSLLLLAALTGVLLLGGCTRQADYGGRVPIAEVDGTMLFVDELRRVLPQHTMPATDSARIADEYVRNWVEEQLLYKQAERNVKGNDEIETMVSDYRRSLILNSYQQQLVEEKVSGGIREEELREFYDSHKELFVLKEPAIRGLLIKAPKSAPGLEELKKWYKRNDDATLEKIEKYSFRNAIIYEYFYDHWVPLSDLDSKIKMNLSDLEHNLQSIKDFQTEDDDYCYLLHVEEFVLEGKQKPYELARPEVHDIMSSQRQVSYMQQVKNDLYERNMEMGKIKYYNKTSDHTQQ